MSSFNPHNSHAAILWLFEKNTFFPIFIDIFFLLVSLPAISGEIVYEKGSWASLQGQ